MSNATPPGKSTFSISLHCPPPPGPAHPSLSGYCQKLETFFRLVSFEGYTLVPSSFQSSPTGKLPYITLNPPSEREHASDASTPDSTIGTVITKEVIPDSYFIIRDLLSRNLLPDPDAKLTPRQKSDSRAQCIWIEHHIYSCIVHQRWLRPHNYPVNKELLPAPWFIKPLLGWYLRRNIGQALWSAGIARYTDEQVDEFVLEWLDNLEERLGGQTVNDDEGKEKWILGAGVGPGLVDATVWGFLANILEVGDGNQEAVRLIRERKGVCDFVRRGGKRWFPEYDIEGMLKGGNGTSTTTGEREEQ